MNILRVVGARPQFVQVKPVSTALHARGHCETLLHTGQHYDLGLSAEMFAELELPDPDVNLGVGSGPHGEQTAAMLSGIERHMQAAGYDAVIVDGDTNSTLAAALAAAKLHVPVVHIEAGMRSFDRRMPEELNRILTDHVSSVLAAPSGTSVANLEREGIRAGVFLTGDVLSESFHIFRERALADAEGLARQYGLEPGEYILLTLHRAENVDDGRRLRAILKALRESPLLLAWPMHPRTRRQLEDQDLWSALARGPFVVVPPMGYLRMLALESAAAGVVTDSGGVQREAYHWQKPSVILRSTTEWPEIVDSGWGRLWLGTDALWPLPTPVTPGASLYDGPGASERIVEAIESLG